MLAFRNDRFSERDRWFESAFLQRRVCKPAVPRETSGSLQNSKPPRCFRLSRSRALAWTGRDSRSFRPISAVRLAIAAGKNSRRWTRYFPRRGRRRLLHLREPGIRGPRWGKTEAPVPDVFSEAGRRDVAHCDIAGLRHQLADQLAAHSAAAA